MHRPAVGQGHTASPVRRLPPITIPTNSVTPYLCSTFGVADATGEDVPRTVLGLAAVGRRHLRVPLACLALWLLPLACLALWLLPLSYVAVLRLEPAAGRHRDLPFCLFYRFDVRLLLAAMDPPSTPADAAPRDAGR